MLFMSLFWLQGFEVENKELQEALSAQIYLSQCYVALAIVRAGKILNSLQFSIV